MSKDFEEKLDKMDRQLTRTMTNVDWLMKFFWVVAAASIGSLITGLLTLWK